MRPKKIYNHFNSLMTTPSLYFTFLLCALSPVLVLGLIYFYTVDIPIGDDWDIIYLFDKLINKNLNFYDLWRQHNEHRIFVPKLLFILSGMLWGFNTKNIMHLSFLIALCTFCLFLLHRMKNKAYFEPNYRWLWIVSSFFIFSPIQYANWTWSFQISWFLNIFAVSLGAYIFSNNELNLRTLFLLFLSGLTASFSMANGLLFWIIIFFMMIIVNKKIKNKIKYNFIIFWLLLSIGVMIAYWVDFQKPGHHPDLFYFLEKPLTALKFFFIYLGAPFSFYKSIFTSIIFGVVGFVVFTYFFFNYTFRCNFDDFKKSSFFLIIGLYCILSAVITSIGRSGFGVDMAFHSRFSTVSMLLVLVNLIFVFRYNLNFILTRKIGGTIMTSTYIFIIIVVLSINNGLNIKNFLILHEQTICARDAVIFGDNPGCSNLIYYDKVRLWKEHIPTLKNLKLSLFNGDYYSSYGKANLILTYDIQNWKYDEGWSIKGNYPENSENYFFGSWQNKIKKGLITSPFVKIEKPIFLRMLVTRCEFINQQKVGIIVFDKNHDRKEIICDLEFNHLTWSPCIVDLSPYIGSNFIIFAEDNGGADRECIGFVRPQLYGFPDNPN